MIKTRAMECAICKEHMKVNDVFYTPCSHAFNYRCITEWLKSSRSCPQCRQIVHPEQLRRMYINMSDDTSLEDELAKYKKHLNDLKIQLAQSQKSILEYRTLHGKLSAENLRITKIMENLKKEYIQNIAKSSTNESANNSKTKDPAIDKVVANLKSEMKSTVAAEREKRLVLMKKCAHEHEENVQLKKDLKIFKNENRAQERQIKELMKIAAPSLPITKPQKTTKQRAKTVPSKVKENIGAKVDPSDEGIASRTRSRTTLLHV